MTDLIDVSPYVSPPRFTGLSGVFLARAVLQAAPAERSRRVQSTLVAVRDAGEALRAVVRDRMRTSPRNLRPLDAQLDAGWVGLRETIEAKSRLGQTDAAERALALLDSLFPNGTSFVRANYREQWAASQLHLERIDEDELATEIEALAGGEFLPFIREAHDAFGEALGLGDEPLEPSDSAALQSAVAALGQAIAEYGRVLAGELDRDDDASVAAFKQAMAPIDTLRAANRRTRTSIEEEPSDDPELEEPLPPVEPTPVVEPQPTA